MHLQTYLMTAFQQICTEHVDVTLNPSDIGMEEVTYHSARDVGIHPRGSEMYARYVEPHDEVICG